MTTATQPLPDSHRSAAARAAADLRTEAWLARLAFGVAALHVVDDNFLQPQPGPSTAAASPIRRTALHSTYRTLADLIDPPSANLAGGHERRGRGGHP